MAVRRPTSHNPAFSNSHGAGHGAGHSAGNSATSVDEATSVTDAMLAAAHSGNVQSAHLNSGYATQVQEPLPTQLRSLRLSGMMETLDARHHQAIHGQWSYIEFLGRLLEDEVARRGQKQLTSRLRRGALNSSKTLEDFNFNFNPQLNRQQVLALAAGDYLREARNVLICGPSGVGKTHLAQALGQEACRQGYDVLFVSTHKMLGHLAGGRADNSVERRLATYLRPDLLILDDFGLRPLPPPGPEDLYDVISERYEKGSILLTSNRAPQEWPSLFGDPLLASAGLDRLGDRAEMLVIRGQSYRSNQGKSLSGAHAGSAHAGSAHAGSAHAGSAHAGSAHAGSAHAGSAHAGSAHAGSAHAGSTHAVLTSAPGLAYRSDLVPEEDQERTSDPDIGFNGASVPWASGGMNYAQAEEDQS